MAALLTSSGRTGKRSAGDYLLGTAVSLPHFCGVSYRDQHVEGSPVGHRFAVLVEDRPPLTAGVVPDADGMVVVGIAVAFRIPVLRDEENGLRVGVDQAIFDVGAIFSDTLGGSAMDKHGFARLQGAYVKGRSIRHRLGFPRSIRRRSGYRGVGSGETRVGPVDVGYSDNQNHYS